MPSFFLHFVRTRLSGWLQSFTVTAIRLTPVCAFSVLKSTDFLCWKAQLKIALFSLLFLQNNWQAWLLTNYKETCQQYSWWKVGSHATYQTFFHPLSSLDPKKIHDSKIRIILLECISPWWCFDCPCMLHAHTHIYIYTDTPRLNITHAGSEHTCEFAVYCTHSWAHSLCMRVRARVRLYVWWVHAVCVCVFNLAGGCTHPLF